MKCVLTNSIMCAFLCAVYTWQGSCRDLTTCFHCCFSVPKSKQPANKKITIKQKEKVVSKIVNMCDHRDDSVVKSTYCSCRGFWSIPSTHTVAYNRLYLSARGSNATFWPPQACMWYTNIYTNNHIYKQINQRNTFKKKKIARKCPRKGKAKIQTRSSSSSLLWSESFRAGKSN